MARVCSIGVPKAILSNVIGKNEAEKLSKADIINVMTDLMSYTGLTQEALLDKKYKPLILNEIKKLNERRPDNKAQEFTSKEKETIVNNAALSVLEDNGIKLDDSLIEDFLADARPNNPYHQVFKQIVDICKANGIPIKIEVDTNLKGIAAMRGSNFTSATIRFNPARLMQYLMTKPKDKALSLVRRIITHELVHAITADVLNSHPSWANVRGFDEAQTKFSEKINALYKQCYIELGESEWYGMTNVKEFIAEALTNSSFQRKLSTIKVEKQNAFEKFVNFVTDLFNSLFNAKGTPIKGSVLEEIISVSQEYFAYANKGINKGIDNIDNFFDQNLFDDGKSEESLSGQVITHLKNLGFKVFGREEMEKFLKEHNLQDLQQAIAEQKEMNTIKQKAIADGTFMKAPNGKPTNLNERQWLQVRTTNFKNWFGDWENNPSEASKVVDENGEPLVVYHGGENNISSFITYHQDSEVGDMYGAYFTKDKKYAKTYNKGTLYEVFLNIKNPLATEGNWTGIINKELKEAVTSKYDGIINDKFDNGILQKLHLAKTRTEVIIFNPNQVKSATNNNGNFSLTDDDIQAAWGKKREIYNRDLETQEINAIQKHIETLSKETDTSNGLWHIVKYTRGANKGKRFAYKFNTSLYQYEQNRADKHDGFEILKKRDITNFSKEQINKLENDIKNRRNIDSVLSEQGTWNEEGTLYDSDVIVDNRQDEGNNDRLDKEALQGEPNGRQDNRNSRDNQGKSEIETFTTPQGEVFGFVDKEGNIYLDETKISPEHPIHEYTHLWDRALQQRNPELWNRGVELMKQTSLWNEILNNENYGKLWQAQGMSQEQLDNLIASEVHARLTGVEGEKILDQLSKKKGRSGIIAKLKQWILDAWKSLGETFGAWSKDKLDKLTLDDFNHMTIRDFAEGVKLQDISNKQQTTTQFMVNKTSQTVKLREFNPNNPVTRESAEKDTETLHIFTDNTNRTSGKREIPDSSPYSKKYGKGKKYPTQTLAMLRGLPNSLPISTQHFYDPATKRTWEAGRWNDEDFAEFKKVIDDEFKEIEKAIKSGKYKRVVMPSAESLFHEKSLPARSDDKSAKTSISDISKERTPKLYKYLKSKYEKLVENLEVQSVEGENISSRGSEFAKKLTNIGNSLEVEYKGKKYRNAEHAYQTWKSGEFDEVAYRSKAFKPRGSKKVNTKTNYQTMVDIITAKLQQHPELVKGITERGGEKYLQASTHEVTGDKYWESTGENKFIEALTEAYNKVTKSSGSTNQTSITKIISGGQTGADTIGLQVAKELGIETGGIAPRGFLREKNYDDGVDITEFGVEEISEEDQEDYNNNKNGGKKDTFKARTEKNVVNSDGTVYFATDEDSAGKIATERFAKEHNKPFLLNPTASELRQWIEENGIKTLNVAGNRGSKLSASEAKSIAKTLKEALTMEEYDSQEQMKKELSEALKKQKEKEAQKKKEAKEALQAERPVDPLSDIDPNTLHRRLLSIMFPNVEDRIAATDLITLYFSQMVATVLDEFKGMYNRDNKEEMLKYMSEDVYEERYKGLFTGTEAQQRLFAMTIPLERSVPLQIIDRLESFLRDFIEQDVDYLVKHYYLNDDDSYNTNFDIFASEFEFEVQDNGWDKDRRKIAIGRVNALKDFFTKHFTKDGKFYKPIMYSLLKDAAFNIEFNEGIRLDMDGAIVESLEEQEDRKFDVENESENPNKEGYMIKYKLINPLDTISTKMKNKLAHLFKLKYDELGWHYVYNKLGFRQFLNPMVAYYVVLDEFSQLSSEDELDATFKKAAAKYPWMQTLKDTVVYNPNKPWEFDIDFRREFFRSCKAYTNYVMVNERGLVAPLNRDNHSSSFLDKVRRDYEGHIVYGKHSIYNEDGTINLDNINTLKNLFKLFSIKNKEGRLDHYEITDFGKAFRTIRDQVHTTVTDLIDAVFLLRGDIPFYLKGELYTIKDLLNDIGIDTNGINIDAILPDPYQYLESQDGGATFEKDSKGNYIFNDDFIAEAAANGFEENVEDYFYVIFNSGLRNYVTSIQQGVDVILRASEGQNLVASHAGAYLKIGNALAIASETYSQTSFQFADNSRFSYSAYDTITRFVNRIKNVSSQEAIDRGTQFIEENFGDKDFYRDPETGEWAFTWLEQLYGIREDHGDTLRDIIYRKNFSVLNVLGLGGNEEKDSIGKVDKETLIDNIIKAYFSAPTTDFREFGYYRNALFSDTDAMVLIKAPRYDRDKQYSIPYNKEPVSYKDKIIYELSKVLKAEIKRIIALEDDSSGPVIDYYNDDKGNGRKFNFFPALNDRRDEIIAAYRSLENDNNTIEFGKKVQVMLNNLLLDIIEGEYDPDLGYRHGGKLEEFLASFDDSPSRRKSIVDAVYQNNNVVNKNRAETFQEQEIEKRLAKEKTSSKKEVSTAEAKLQDAYDKDFREVAEEFFYNDYFAQSQFIGIFGGDLAYYKNFRDFIKRNKQAYAAGDRLYGMLMDEQGNNIERLTEKCIYLKDTYEVSNTYNSIKNLLNSSVGVSEMTRDMILGALEPYKNICATDGQSLRTPASMKKILTAMGGKWTEDMEEAYQRITEDKALDIKDFYTIWNNIKPFLYSHESVQVSGRTERVPVQHKNSEYMLTALYNLIGNALTQSPQLRALQAFMDNHDIDVAHFRSVVKEGGYAFGDITHSEKRFNELKGENDFIEVGNQQIGAKDYDTFYKNLTKALDEGLITQDEFNQAVRDTNFKEGDEGDIDCYEQLERYFCTDDSGENWVLDDEDYAILNENKVHTIPLSDYMIVQPSGDHLTEDDLEAVFGSQLRNIIPADLPESFNTEVTIGGKKKKLSRDEYIKFYNTLIVDQLLDSFEQVSKEFSSIQNLQQALLKKAHGNPKYGDDVRDALQINEDGTGFKIPFNNPNLRNKLTELILSTFKNSIQRQKINGGNIILVSNFGLTDKLHVKYKKDGSIDYIPCYMPAYKRTLIQDFLQPVKNPETGEEWWELSYEKLKKEGNEDLLRMIGYRIPTEDKYSIMPLRIEGFLPISAGTAIMLPSDIVTMSGTDFDKHQC